VAGRHLDGGNDLRGGTPLLVTGLVAKNGIAGNWLWWSQCLSGMMTFSFSRAIEALGNPDRRGIRGVALRRKAPPLFCGAFARCISAL